MITMVMCLPFLLLSSLKSDAKLVIDPPPTTERSYFVLRHGQTDANAQGLIQGSSDFSRLTDLGKEQAAAIGQALLESRVNIGAIYVSPLTRARDTLKIIQTQYLERRVVGQPERGDDGPPPFLPSPTKLYNLREIDLYGWEERHKDELKTEHPVAWQAWKDPNPNQLIIPDGSDTRYPLLELWERADTVWRDIRAREQNRNNEAGMDHHDNQAHTLLVAHGSLGQALLGTAMGWDATHFRTHVFPNCGMMQILWDPSKDRATKWRWLWPTSSDWSFYEESLCQFGCDVVE